MLTRLRLQGFKSWRDTGDIALKPITGFFGPNSSGKASLIQALLLLKQTAGSPDRRLAFHFGGENTPADQNRTRTPPNALRGRPGPTNRGSLASGTSRRYTSSSASTPLVAYQASSRLSIRANSSTPLSKR